MSGENVASFLLIKCGRQFSSFRVLADAALLCRCWYRGRPVVRALLAVVAMARKAGMKLKALPVKWRLSAGARKASSGRGRQRAEMPVPNSRRAQARGGLGSVFLSLAASCPLGMSAAGSVLAWPAASETEAYEAGGMRAASSACGRSSAKMANWRGHRSPASGQVVAAGQLAALEARRMKRNRRRCNRF